MELANQDLNASESGAQESSGSDLAPSGGSPAAPSGQPVALQSLDNHTYNGRPLKEWESGYIRQQDYTQKTQALAQDRRYFDNLHVDLDRVKSNPALVDQFKQVYPERFHAYLRFAIAESQNQERSQQSNQQAQQYARLDPKFEAEFNQMKENLRQKEVAAISAELDAKFKTFSQKYPFADEEAVVARAQALLAKMKEIDPTRRDVLITDRQWDALWKSQNDRAYSLTDAQYKKQVQSQLQASKKAADVGGGGGVPGQAPRRHKSIKEATAAALADIEGGSL